MSAEAIKSKIEIQQLSAWFGAARALKEVSLSVPERSVLAIIGPSGCGKSTFVRCINRMHELIPGARQAGHVLIDGHDLHGKSVDPVDLRRRVGMVFQRPNPFPTMNILDNTVAGLRMNGVKKKSFLLEAAEAALRQAALWDEVKSRLRSPAISLSGGQQQRLCIARALAVEPEVLLLDEPCSALDPRASAQIEQLIVQLSEHIALALVTHNLFQARRISDRTAVFLLGEDGAGELVESGPTAEVFEDPKDPRTKEYVTGHIG
jgi:phosphate transport system ATP-binding protein